MRIAMVSEHASPLATIGGADGGGQNVHVAALAEALVRRDHEVTVYTRRDDADLPAQVVTASGYVVEHVPAGPPKEVPKDTLLPYMPQFGRYLAARLRVNPVDVLHSHFWMSGLASVPAAREVAVPLIHTFHALGAVKRRHQGSRDTSPPNRLHLERRLCREVGHVIATCTDEVRELTRMRLPRDRVSVVPCGVDVSAFRPDGPVAVRRGPRLLIVGRLVERKGVDDAIRALALVPDAELVVAGGPLAEDLDVDPEVARLRRVAAVWGVAERVLFLGRVSRAAMPALLRSADVVLAVPWYEPFGIVPLEAMACGRPVVACAVGGLSDTVVDGRTGILVPPRNPARLADSLNRLLADPDLRRTYGNAGLVRARARYSWDRVATNSEAVYERAVAATGDSVRAEAYSVAEASS